MSGQSNLVPQALFGPGILFVTPLGVANPTPVNIGYINEFSTDVKYSTKQLYGQKSAPLIVARGTAKLTGKMKPATLSGQALNALMLGGSWTAGTQYDLTNTPATAIPETPFQITPTVPSSGTWNSDLGVVNAATNEPMTAVASSPSAGQYSVSAGVYTFSTADHSSGISVIISFSYTFTGGTGQSMIWTNQNIGTSPTVQLDYKTALFGNAYYLRIFQAIAGGWTEAHKLEDFSMPEFDFEFMDNGLGQIGIISLASQA